MCIAIAKPANTVIPKETLEQCFISNPDGAGYMFPVKKKGLEVKKGFFTFEDFWNEYKKDQYRTSAIHFRIRTCGNIDEENCHPFLVNDNLGFIHNGIIQKVDTKKDSTKSDSWHFNESILKNLPENFTENNSIVTLLENFIGWSKIVFLDSKGQLKIFNSKKGEWDKNVWYSNSSWKIPSAKISTHTEIQPFSPNKVYSKPLTIGAKVFSKKTKEVYTIVAFGKGMSVFCTKEGGGTETYLLNLLDLSPHYEEEKIITPTKRFLKGELLVVHSILGYSKLHLGDTVEVISDIGNRVIKVKSVWDFDDRGSWEDRNMFSLAFPGEVYY